MSLPEAMIWKRLRGAATGCKFRRQHPIGPYIVDFFCAEGQLVIEIDGSQHAEEVHRRRDEERDRYMNENGYRVMRIGATDVLRDIEGAIASIVSRAASPLHHAEHGPPPRSGED